MTPLRHASRNSAHRIRLSPTPRHLVGGIFASCGMDTSVKLWALDTPLLCEALDAAEAATAPLSSSSSSAATASAPVAAASSTSSSSASSAAATSSSVAGVAVVATAASSGGREGGTCDSPGASAVVRRVMPLSVEMPAFNTIAPHCDYVDDVHWVGDALLTKAVDALDELGSHVALLWCPSSPPPRQTVGAATSARAAQGGVGSGGWEKLAGLHTGDSITILRELVAPGVKTWWLKGGVFNHGNAAAPLRARYSTGFSFASGTSTGDVHIWRLTPHALADGAVHTINEVVKGATSAGVALPTTMVNRAVADARSAWQSTTAGREADGTAGGGASDYSLRNDWQDRSNVRSPGERGSAVVDGSSTRGARAGAVAANSERRPQDRMLVGDSASRALQHAKRHATAPHDAGDTAGAARPQPLPVRPDTVDRDPSVPLVFPHVLPCPPALAAAKKSVPVRCVGWSPDGLSIVAGLDNGVVLVYDDVGAPRCGRVAGPRLTT